MKYNIQLSFNLFLFFFFFSRSFKQYISLDQNSNKEVCSHILKVNTHVKPATAKGDGSKSVLFDASIYSGQRVEQIGAGEEMDIGKQSVGRIACCHMSNK